MRLFASRGVQSQVLVVRHEVHVGLGHLPIRGRSETRGRRGRCGSAQSQRLAAPRDHGWRAAPPAARDRGAVRSPRTRILRRGGNQRHPFTEPGSRGPSGSMERVAQARELRRAGFASLEARRDVGASRDGARLFETRRRMRARRTRGPGSHSSTRVAARAGAPHAASGIPRRSRNTPTDGCRRRDAARSSTVAAPPRGQLERTARHLARRRADLDGLVSTAFRQ